MRPHCEIILLLLFYNNNARYAFHRLIDAINIWLGLGSLGTLYLKPYPMLPSHVDEKKSQKVRNEQKSALFQVVEYSEITPSAARLRNADDSLTYWAANLCIHFFTLDFLRRVCNKHERQLVHHIAKKKIPHVGADGAIVRPEKPNGIKMEKFVFDVFRFAENFVVWACVREDEFAPLKNAEGASDFTPTHCRDGRAMDSILFCLMLELKWRHLCISLIRW